MASKPLQSESEVRIVLLGKTGVGKSTAGNLILGHNRFKTKVSPSSVTTECQKETREYNGQTLVVVDTPGLCHTEKNDKKVMSEIIESNMLYEPGPHVLLLVLRSNAFIDQDEEVLETFQKVFDKAKPYTIVLFMHKGKDQCKADHFIQNNEALKKFIAESCEEHHVFTDKEPPESEVTGLLQKINNMVKKNENHYYSNEMLEKAATVVEKMPRLMVKSAEKVITIVKEANLKRGLEENQFVKWLVSQIGGTEIEEAKKLHKALLSYLTIVEMVTYNLMPDGSKK